VHIRPLLAIALAIVGATISVSSAQATTTVQYVGSWGFSGPAGLYAYGLDFDPSNGGSILVGDYWNYRVQRFSTTGTHLATYPDVTGLQANGGIASAPYDIAVDPTDKVPITSGGVPQSTYWVADQGSSNFAQFAYNGTWIRTIGAQQASVNSNPAFTGHPGATFSASCTGGGHMMIPTHIMVDTVTNDDIYVGDPQCRNVYIFNHQAQFLGALNWSNSGIGTPIPRGIAEDSSGNIYVAEYNSRRIFVFSPWDGTTNGGKIIASSAALSDFRDVRGIALDQTNHLIYAAGAALNRVYEFSFDQAQVNAGGGASNQAVKFVNEWRNTDGTNYALNHQAFDSIRFVAVDNSGNVYTGDTWGCPTYAPQCTAPTPDLDPGYRVLKFHPNDWTAKASCNPSNSTAQTTCAGATAFDPAASAPFNAWNFPSEPPPQGGFNQQNGIAVVPNDSEATGGADGLYVVDTFEQRVQKFDTSKTCASAGSCPAWIRQWGGRAPSNPNNEGFGYPRALTYESTGPNRYIWVGDNNNDVMAFTQTGTFVHRFGSQGKTPGQFSGGVQGIRVQGGLVYATDKAGCRLQVFDEAKLLTVSSGTSALEDVVGSCGTATTTSPNLMAGPRGIAVDPNDPSTVYVIDSSGNSIRKWKLTLGAPGSYSGGGTATLIKPSCVSGTTAKGLANPWGITYEGPVPNDGSGWYYIGDVNNNRIVRWQPNGTATGTCQVVWEGANGPPTMKGANYVEFGADPSPGTHRMYVSDNSRHIYAFDVTG
jgi:tripartite motif-containing protein 71